MIRSVLLLLVVIPLLAFGRVKEQNVTARYMQEIKTEGLIEAKPSGDFSSRFMKEKKGNKDVKFVTISPRMLREMMSRASDKHKAEILSHIKSIRIVEVGRGAEKYHTEALDLLQKNKNRYQQYGASESRKGQQVWMRKKKDSIVELITLLLDKEGRFKLVNVTGEMDDEFIQLMTEM